MSKKWLNATFLSFTGFASRIRSRAAKSAKYENLWVFIRSDAHVVRAGLNIRGCGPLSTLGFFDRLWPPLIPGGLMSLFSVFRIYILYRLLMARFFLRQLAFQLCPLCLQLAFHLFQRPVILRVIRGLLEQYV